MPSPESSSVRCVRPGCGHLMIGGHVMKWNHDRTFHIGACVRCSCPQMKHPGFWRYLWQQFWSA